MMQQFINVQDPETEQTQPRNSTEKLKSHKKFIRTFEEVGSLGDPLEKKVVNEAASFVVRVRAFSENKNCVFGF